MRLTLRAAAALASVALPSLPALADAPDPRRQAAIEAAVEAHALPGFLAFAGSAVMLSKAAVQACPLDAPDPDAPALRGAWAAAFDAWIRVSHLRFGPTEQKERAFALAFWPDPKGFTPRSLRRLLAGEIPGPKGFAQTSIAGRGFYAMERLLFDAEFQAADPAARCALLRAQAHDVARIATEIDMDWRAARGPMLLAHDGEIYPRQTDAARELYKALDAGLQFMAEARLGRPLGTYERPRPKRAEARRSGRSLRHVRLALDALDRLHLALAAPYGGAPRTEAAFAAAEAAAAALEDPAFAGVADPTGRFRVEALQTAVEQIRLAASEEIGPALGVSAGFNSLDGD